MKFNVTAFSMNRQTRRQSGPARAELIDTDSNRVFEGQVTPLDVERRYEAFWNDVNPRSRDIVKVMSVEPVDSTEAER